MPFGIEPDEGCPPSESLPLTLIVTPAKASDPASLSPTTSWPGEDPAIFFHVADARVEPAHDE